MKSNVIFSVVSLLFACCTVWADDTFYVIESSDGREIRAKVLDISVKMIEIEREDGSRFDVWKEQLSDGTLKLVKKLEHERTLADPDNFDIGLSTRRQALEKSNPQGVTREKETLQCKIRINKPAAINMDGFEIDYRVFVRRDQSDSISEYRGTKFISESADEEEIEILTDGFDLYTSQLLSGWTWDLPKRRYEDEVEGMWVRVYQGDTLILEEVTPQRLQRTTEWPYRRDTSAPIPAGRAR